MAQKNAYRTYLPLLLLIVCWLPASTATAQPITLNRMPVSVVNNPGFDLYDLRRPALSLTGFDNTEPGYNAAHGLGLKQVLELVYNDEDLLVSKVFDEIIETANTVQLDPYALDFGPDRRNRHDQNTNILQCRAFEALVTFVLERNGYDPESPDFGLRSHEEARDALLQALTNPPGGNLIYDGNQLLIDDFVRYPRSIGNVARAIDLYLALENAYYQFPEEADPEDLMNFPQRIAVFEQFAMALFTPEIVLTTKAVDVYIDEIDYLTEEEKAALLAILEQLPEGDNTVEEVESGNWSMKQRLGIGYGSLAMQAIPGSQEEALLMTLLPKALVSADLTSAELYDRFRHWNFMTYGGKRFWAESPYYFDFALEQVLPFWHALRANGLLGSAPDPFINPVFLNPIEWMADIVTPDGRFPGLDDGNKAHVRHCGLMRWKSGYGNADVGKKCAWIDDEVGGPGHRREILLSEIAIPRIPSSSVDEPAEFIGNAPGPLVPHVSEQQLVSRYASHYVLLNGEHGKSVDRGEGHEQPDQLHLLYYKEALSYLMDSGYTGAGTVDNSFWNHYYDHNAMTVGGGEGGLMPPELRILEVRKASEPDLMGEVDALYSQRYGKIRLLHGEQELRTGPEREYTSDYARDVLIIEDANPYLIDINRIRQTEPPEECQWNAFAMNYHVNSDNAYTPAGYTPSSQGFMRWSSIDGESGAYLHAFPMSVEFDLAPEYVQIVADNAMESQIGGIKIPVDIDRLTLTNPDWCEPFWSLATVFQAGVSQQVAGDRPEMIWNYDDEDITIRQGWVWPRDEATYDVFVARSVNQNLPVIAFNLRQANRNFPNLRMKLPTEAPYGFARVVSTPDGWEVDSEFQVHLEQIGGSDKTIADADLEGVPTEFALDAAYPNPFNPTTTIRYSIPEQARVRLAVYDMLGREVKLLVNEVREAGIYEVEFDAGSLATGTYLYRLETPAGSFVGRMILVK